MRAPVNPSPERTRVACPVLKVLGMERKTILVPIDFRDPSLDALATAREFARPLDLDVVLLHVYYIPVAVYPGFDPIIVPGLPEQIAAAAKNALDQLAREQGGLRTLLRTGDPATEILHAIEEIKPSLVAMGTHGRKGLSHLLIGSVTEKVVRSSPVPVLTLHARAR